MARRYRVFPVALDRQQKKFIVALSDTNNIVAIDQLRAHLKGEFEVELRLAGDTEIDRAIEHYYGHEFSIDGILKEIETGEVDYTTIVDGDEYSQPVVRLISALLADSVERAASDIHFEPEQNFLRIRYRIDGVLRQIRSLHKTYWPAMAVRIKVMAKMNIAETRAPQDGRISATMSGRVVDFRVASLPTSHGENLVLRVLDRQKGIVPLDKLGLEEEQLELLKRMIARPEGIILVTGPTGSGKTTTLYSILNHINSDGINVMTLEDPVEYPMTLILKTSAAEAAKLDFANGIRAMMRQDPDVILVGEIRAQETAEMAFRAAMTGHQVYTTLHTNSAVGAFPRLLDIGIVPDILAGNIIGILAQRLVRRLCRTCRQSYDPDARERRLLGVTPTESAALYRAVGCEHCDYQGFRGRQSILEILKVDGALDEMVARRATARPAHRVRQSHAPGPDQLLLSPRAARQRRGAGHGGAGRPARERREPALPGGGVRDDRIDRRRSQPVASARRVPRGVWQGVREPRALRRADRKAARGAAQPLRVAEVGGRACGADKEAVDVPGVRRQRRAAGHLLPDGLPGAADDRVHPQHGAGHPAADAHPDGGVRLFRELLVGRRRRAVRRLVRPQACNADKPGRRVRRGPLQDHHAADRPDPEKDHPVAFRRELRHDVCLWQHGPRRDPQLRAYRRV